MLETLEAIDTNWLIAINNLTFAGSDQIWLFASGKLTWSPFYLMLLFLLKKRVDTKQLWFVLVAIAVLVLITDQVCTHLFKNMFMRLRPCFREDLLPYLRIVGSCGGKWSYLSAHAANSSAVATFFALLFKDKRMTLVLGIWAVLVSVSRVFLGVHFPLDVLSGMLLGVLLGHLVFYSLQRIHPIATRVSIKID